MLMVVMEGFCWLVHSLGWLIERLPYEKFFLKIPFRMMHPRWTSIIPHEEEEIGEDEEEEGAGQNFPPNALGNVEDATQDVGDGEAVPDQEKLEEELRTEVQVFRMVIPTPSKNAPTVIQTTIGMILRLRSNHYPIHPIHTNRGREFLGPFKGWMRSRAILVTQTPRADPQGDGRAKRAVPSIKQQIRRVLHGAGADTKMWAFAAMKC